MRPPEQVDPHAVRLAIERVRAESDEAEVDIEALAAFLEGGIDAVPPESRAALLVAVGQHPEVAALVADVVAERGVPATLRLPAPLGIPQVAWRTAWAACTLLSLGLTMWALTSGAGDSGNVVVLDGAGATAREPSFREWFEGRPLHYTIFGLWLVMCLLAIPSLAPAPQRDASGGRRPGAQ